MKNLNLQKLPAESELINELNNIVKVDKKELEKYTDNIFVNLLTDNLDINVKKKYVRELGLKYQAQYAKRSKILDSSIRSLAHTQEGGPVATSLLKLRNEVEELNPNKYDLTNPPSAIAKFFRRLIGKKNPLSKYFEKYESAQHVIENIIADLTAGRDALTDDNKTLELDKEVMLETLDGISRAIEMGNMLYKKLENALNTEYNPKSSMYKFIQEELLFPLNQRIIDLQTTLAVNQQGIISYDLLIRNNNELINGVNRTITITTSALRIAVATRIVLNKQKQVLDAKKKIDQTTSDLIESNSELIKTQGLEIQKEATKPAVNVEKLINSFNMLYQAMDEISTYRRDSLPLMRETVNKFQILTDQAQNIIDKVEKSEAVQKNNIIDITDFKVVEE